MQEAARLPRPPQRLGSRLELTSPAEAGFLRGLGTPSSSSRFAAVPTQERSARCHRVFHGRSRCRDKPTLTQLLPVLKAGVSAAGVF